jgi:hypothetical protein
MSSPAPVQDPAPRPEKSSSLVPARFRALFAIDVRSLALFRIGLALLLLADLTARSTDLIAHYTDAGVLPRRALPNNWSSLHLLNGSPWFQAVLFLAAGLLAVLLLLGFHTRLATFGSWVMLASLQARNRFLIDGGDALLRLLLFWSMFLPLGACWSLDARRSSFPRNPAGSIASVATAGLLLQICFVYWFGAALKSDPAWWREGTAIGYVLCNDHWATPLGRSLLAYPELLKVLTFATLALEVVAPALAFAPLFTGPIRITVVLVFLLFHAALGLCMELGLFPYVCGVAWLVFIPAGFWDKLPGLFRRPAGPVGEVSAATRDLQLFPAGNALAACCLLYVFLWNVKTLNEEEFGKVIPKALTSPGYAFGLNQSWDMFARGLQTNGWYVVQGTLKDERQVDVLKGNGPVDWERPPLASGNYKSYRWRKLASTLMERRWQEYRKYYAEYLCKEWNARHPEHRHLKAVTIYFMSLTTLPDFKVSEPQKLLLGKVSCGGSPRFP